MSLVRVPVEKGGFSGMRSPILLFFLLVIALVLFAFLRPRRTSDAVSAEVLPANPSQSSTESASPTPSITPPPQSLAVGRGTSPLETTGGLRLVRVRMASAGAAVEITYTVTDLDKAKDLALADPPAFLVLSATGARIGMGTAIPQSKALLAHSRMRAALMSNQQGLGFPPLPGRLLVGKPYQSYVPNIQHQVEAGVLCYIECNGLQSDSFSVDPEL